MPKVEAGGGQGLLHLSKIGLPLRMVYLTTSPLKELLLIGCVTVTQKRLSCDQSKEL